MKDKINKVYICGGETLYNDAILLENIYKIYITRINKKYICDTFFPNIDNIKFNLYSISKTKYYNDISYDNLIYINNKFNKKKEFDISTKIYRNHEEYQYLNMIKHLIQNGESIIDRTSTGVLQDFGASLTFSLENNAFPLLTTKKVFFRAIVEELLWFLSGQTNSKILSEKNINIWERNSTKEYLNSINLNHYNLGDCGPIYGFQWRHWNAKYTDCNTNYHGMGIDQLKNLINNIKNNPNSRRLILSAWNVEQIPEMALPPCHIICQFHVSKKKLSCQLYQRSADVGLGLPFNIASYALLTIILSRICSLSPDKLIITIGNYHIYNNHIEQLKEQIERKPNKFPTLIIETDKEIDKFKYEDFKLINYNPYSAIKMNMAI
tara:strand:- start:3761 stop:4900 length:1140 start_codon:yes stop_codon:yes gene_type:complete